MTNKAKILIIGKIPPPVGGVTIHTYRLLQLCDQEKFEYIFYDLQKYNLYCFLKTIRKSKIAHLHSCNPIFILLFVLLCRLLKTKSIITIHGNIGSYRHLQSLFEKLAIRFCNIPILLNDGSLKNAKKLNQNAKLISPFIPPLNEKKLNEKHKCQIDVVKRNSKTLFCTNAYDLVFDKFGKEIYGVISLINFFNSNFLGGLIFSDPKGSYLTYLEKNNFIFSKNIAILTGEHSFSEVLKVSDCFIRNTITDGDSLSIKEALFLNKNVIATNCVERPEGVEIIGLGNIFSLENAISKMIKNQNRIHPKQIPINGGIALLNLYKELLKK